jgi:malate dehydrogenase (oxaloacetate-decarboxylating)
MKLGVSLTGYELLDSSLQNKGTAFSEEERIELGLLGLLPPHIETLEVQIGRAYNAYSMFETDMERHNYLQTVQDTNEILFYGLLKAHLTEMMPIVYTPVVGEACQTFSEIFRRPRGLFIAYPNRDRIDQILDNSTIEDVRVIVVTDGERILGLGDQGAGGMGIPIGKLSLYTACGGIDPDNVLPIFLDVGTNNQQRLDDPFYIGWRHERISGDDYYRFVDAFVQAIKRKWPQVLLQFEDFAQTHASPLLHKYRDQLCTFNDDIQGTAAVTVGTILSAVKVAGVNLTDLNVAFLGAGSAGCGIAEQLVAAMIGKGLDEASARRRFFMVDRNGLIHDGMDSLLDFQKGLAQPKGNIDGWLDSDSGQVSLDAVVRNAKPSILIGVSGQPGLFTETIIRDMAAGCEQPMIFPLSNPTSRIEAIPADLLKWTDGRALIATGSPFDPVSYQGKDYPIAQCNNSYIFPGMGLGILAVGATRVTDAMFMGASEALSASSPALETSGGALLPSLSEIQGVSSRIALAVGLQAITDRVAGNLDEDQVRLRIEKMYWEPRYREMGWDAVTKYL